MPIEVEAPDGSIVEFPDGTSTLEMQAAMARTYGRPAKNDQGLGFAVGVNTVAQNMAPRTPADPRIGPFEVAADLLKPVIDNSVARGAADGRKPGEIGRYAGEFVASLPLAAIGGPMTAGALQGFAASRADNFGGQLADAALGAVGGKIGAAVVGKVASALGDDILPAARRLASVGVRLTPGQARGGAALAKEDKLMSLPVVSDTLRNTREQALEAFQRATVNRALNPLGITLPDNIGAGHEAVAFMQDQVRKAYDDIIPNLGVRIDPKTLAPRATPFVSSLPKAMQTQYNSILKNLLRDGDLVGRDLKRAHGELRRLASAYSTSSDAFQREMGNALGEVAGRLETAMIAQNPTYGPLLKQANRAFRGERIVEDAASRGRASDGVPSPAQFQQAVRKADRTKGKNATAAGSAFMQDMAKAGAEVLPSRAPNTSGTASHMKNNILGYGRGLLANTGLKVSQGLTDVVMSPQGSAIVDPIARVAGKSTRPAAVAAATAVPSMAAAEAAPAEAEGAPQSAGVTIPLPGGAYAASTPEGRPFVVERDGSWRWVNP